MKKYQKWIWNKHADKYRRPINTFFRVVTNLSMNLRMISHNDMITNEAGFKKVETAKIKYIPYDNFKVQNNFQFLLHISWIQCWSRTVLYVFIVKVGSQLLNPSHYHYISLKREAQQRWFTSLYDFSFNLLTIVHRILYSRLKDTLTMTLILWQLEVLLFCSLLFCLTP